jgi:hypothetical protein
LAGRRLSLRTEIHDLLVVGREGVADKALGLI